jgi:hypothetical protein
MVLAADDQGLALTCGHASDPGGLLILPFAPKIGEFPDMVHLADTCELCGSQEAVEEPIE